MTNEEMYTDLKQFISAQLSQNLYGLEQRFDGLEQRFDGLEQRFDGLQQEMNERFDTVLDAVGTEVSEIKDSQKDHEVRITKLEARAV